MNYAYRIAVKDAWLAYLRACRRFGPDRLGYELAEPACWQQLQRELSEAKERYGGRA